MTLRPRAPRTALLVLASMQRELEAIYGVTSPAHVEDFLIGTDERRDLAGGPARAPEELLVLEEAPEELSVALYLHEELVAQLAHAGAWQAATLSALCTALEGVSHFVYLTWRAAAGGRVSQLELEAQAEVDKFAACLFSLWRRGRREEAPLLWERLFERVSWREGLAGQEAERYRLANMLAGAYCRLLASRAQGDGTAEAMLRDLRRVYRLSSSDKLAALKSPLPG